MSKLMVAAPGKPEGTAGLSHRMRPAMRVISWTKRGFAPTCHSREQPSWDDWNRWCDARIAAALAEHDRITIEATGKALGRIRKQLRDEIETAAHCRHAGVGEDAAVYVISSDGPKAAPR